MKRLALTIFFVFLFPVLIHSEQVHSEQIRAEQIRAEQIRAFVDRTQAALGESVQLTVSVSGGEGRVDVSPIQDFKVISRGTSTSIQIINGRSSREVAYNYILIPLQEGRLKIPSLTVVSDGKTHKTREIVVKVSKRSQNRAGNRDVFVNAHISNQNPYEGEQIIYTFKLCNAIQIANANFQKPDFSGFTAKEVENGKTYQTVISGRQYNVTELTYVLVPLTAGVKKIEPAILNCDIVQRNNSRRGRLFDSFFNDPFFGRADLESKIFRTKPLTVNVKQLPAYAGEVKFSGLVGKFDIKTELEDTKINVGDSTTLSVIIKGTGNIMDAEEPEMTVPEAFKAYKDTPEEGIYLDIAGYSGKKVFRIALVAINEGRYSLAPIQLSYFNVSTGRYKTLSTQPLSLTVNPSADKDKFEVFSAPATNVQSLKKKVEFTGRDILPLKEELDALESREKMSLVRFIIFLLIPVVPYLAVKAAFIFTQKSDNPASIMAQRAERALKEACTIGVSGEEFLSCLYRALISVIFSKAGTKGESLTYTEAQEILRSNGYSDEIATQAAKLLEKIESTKYSGLSMEKAFKEELLSETRDLVRKLF